MASPSKEFASFPAPSADRPGTEYEKACDDQSSALAALEDLLGTLATRLAPVLVPETIFRNGEKLGSDSVEAVPAQLIATLRGSTCRVQVASDRITALLNRLCI